MPSQNQPADTSDRLQCPALVEDIGEDPARWLDWDLLADTARAEIVRTLIDGIDTVERLRAWRAVERKLANDDENDGARNPLEDPRGRIMQRLDQREEWLKLNGERPDRLAFGPRECCDCCEVDGYLTAADLREREAEEMGRRSEGYSPSGVDTSQTTPETEAPGLGELATDGGMHTEDLADSTGLSVSTIYRMLQRLDGVVESDNGHVQFVSQKIREQVRSLVESAEYAIENAAERAGELVNMDMRQSASSAFDTWLARYGAEVDWPDQDGGTVKVRLDTVLSKLKSLDGPHPREVIVEMFNAWKRDGRNPTILDGAEIEATVRNEGRLTLTATPP